MLALPVLELFEPLEERRTRSAAPIVNKLVLTRVLCFPPPNILVHALFALVQGTQHHYPRAR